MTNVFVTYSLKDRRWLERLLPYLEREPGVDVWHDGCLDAGDLWDEEIHEAIDSSQISICLVSENFLASSFCADSEIPKLLKKQNLILPVLLRQCSFQHVHWLKSTQMLPGRRLSIEDLDESEQATVFEKVARKAAQALEASTLENFILKLDEIEQNKGSGRNLWVQAGLDFPSYTHFIQSIVSRLSASPGGLSLKIYNVYQPQHFLLDLIRKLDAWRTHPLHRLIDGLEPMIHKILRPGTIERGSRREQRYWESRDFIRSIMNGNKYIDEEIETEMRSLCNSVLPSLDRINEFSNRCTDRLFRRITILRTEYLHQLLPEHFYLFDLMIQASDRHFVIEDGAVVPGPSVEPHDSDFCIWSTPVWELVTDYYPSSKVLIVAWRHTGRTEANGGGLVDHYRKLFEHVERNSNLVSIREYADDFARRSAVRQSR